MTELKPEALSVLTAGRRGYVVGRIGGEARSGGVSQLSCVNGNEVGAVV